MAKKKKVKLLFCVNDRGEGKRSCAGSGANALRKHAKAQVADQPNIRVKKSACLGHCKHGPVVELLPGKVMYQCIDEAAVDLMLASLTGKSEIVPSLLIKAGKRK